MGGETGPNRGGAKLVGGVETGVHAFICGADGSRGADLSSFKRAEGFNS